MEFAVYACLVLLVATAIMTAVMLIRAGRPVAMPPELSTRIAVLEQVAADLQAAFRDEARISREDLRSAVSGQGETIDQRLAGLETRVGEAGKAQTDQLAEMRREAADGRDKFEKALVDRLGAMRIEAADGRNKLEKGQVDRLDAMRAEAVDGRDRLEKAVQRNADGFTAAQAERLKETHDAVTSLSDRLLAAQRNGRDEQRLALEGVTGKVGQLIESNETKQEALRGTVADGLEKLRVDNADKLEQMRATVEEKLQGTLDKRLGASFQLVSDRLEQVHKGLGEMQVLATGVGDLKRVLSNVKSRGGWGEMQLGMLLGDMLTADQFASNVRIRPDSGESVEFAVRLPGHGEAPLWLPIDAKFPHEDYDRLLVAQDSGAADEIEKAGAALERAIRVQAKLICEKYVHPPHSTDFGIMYLPTEGLFAEVIRRPGLSSELQSKYRIMIQGPTTLAALLTSLQMGFRTLAIEKRSSEVWQVLGLAKAEFVKYGDVWERLGKQLDTAKRTVDEAGRRTRAVTRSLRDVETLNAPEAPPLLELVVGDLEMTGAAAEC